MGRRGDARRFGMFDVPAALLVFEVTVPLRAIGLVMLVLLSIGNHRREAQAAHRESPTTAPGDS